MPIPYERHPFLRGVNDPGDSGLILSTDAKPRLKWTPDLHERFVKAVNQLDGADKATPKAIMKVMGVPGLTLYHLKSHLQKYRLSKNLNGQANYQKYQKYRLVAMAEEKSHDANEIHTESFSIGQPTEKNLPISEALQMQVEVQQRLHEQLERHLQLRIEAHGKYLQAVLEKAHETLGKQNLGTDGIEAAKVQLSELASKVSAEYSHTTFQEPKELQSLHPQQMETYPSVCSLDSSLTSRERNQTIPKIVENRLGLRPYHGDSKSEQKEISEQQLFQRLELAWSEGQRETRTYFSTMVNDTEARISSSERSLGNLSIGIGLYGQKGQENTGYTEERTKKDEDCKFETRNQKGMDSTTELDLNTHGENYDTARPKQFDLNGFSWN
ncbi:PREDICTED: myb-related protein 2-like isoform X2 [Tarenaya hassleriana]|uniref:myb-related protein 2-like isoform X2 n=1 Tax=Tarenaya hassleriana TaxID=28532 RepID=UPI00053C351C|nr:PREDICTED: myb-related protein 2-like isoform X2 [Tarenaya hassleriana]